MTEDNQLKWDENAEQNAQFLGDLFAKMYPTTAHTACRNFLRKVDQVGGSFHESPMYWNDWTEIGYKLTALTPEVRRIVVTRPLPEFLLLPLEVGSEVLDLARLLWNFTDREIVKALVELLNELEQTAAP